MTRPGDRGAAAIAEATPEVFWRVEPRPDLDADARPPRSVDLAVIGGGLTGLWAAILALEEAPGRSVVVLEADRIGAGASGRNGGFVAASLTHGLPHGARTWPDEIDVLQRLGRENLDAIGDFLAGEGIEADLRHCGKTTVATRPHELAVLAASEALNRRHGEDVELLDEDAMRADVASPTYLGGLRIRSGYALVDPGRLVAGLATAAVRRGAVIVEGTRVEGLAADRSGGVRLTTPSGSYRARQVLIATNADPAPLRRLRHYIVPVYDHVLVTEPIDEGRWRELGWSERQGITDAGNEFHYYRPTADGRILWGGYAATYHFGSSVDAAHEQDSAIHRTLAEHFLATFPQLEGIRFTHRWGGAIDSTSRFTPVFGTALRGRVAWALGYTGLGVGASRFGALVGLDLLARRSTERTRLELVRRRPLPFPPEPLRWLGIRLTQAELARQDRNGGRASPWLRLLDRLGLGFSS